MADELEKVQTELRSSEVAFGLEESAGRRLGIERRRFAYTVHIPERRGGDDRRKDPDRRNSMERRKVIDATISINRRSCMDRRNCMV